MIKKYSKNMRSQGHITKGFSQLLKGVMKDYFIPVIQKYPEVSKLLPIMLKMNQAQYNDNGLDTLNDLLKQEDLSVDKIENMINKNDYLQPLANVMKDVKDRDGGVKLLSNMMEDMKDKNGELKPLFDMMNGMNKDQKKIVQNFMESLPVDGNQKEQFNALNGVVNQFMKSMPKEGKQKEKEFKSVMQLISKSMPKEFGSKFQDAMKYIDKTKEERRQDKEEGKCKFNTKLLTNLFTQYGANYIRLKNESDNVGAEEKNKIEMFEGHHGS